MRRSKPLFYVTLQSRPLCRLWFVGHPPPVLEFAPAWAVNSAVECHLHTVEATGSIPVPPTNEK